MLYKNPAATVAIVKKNPLYLSFSISSPDLSPHVLSQQLRSNSTDRRCSLKKSLPQYLCLPSLFRISLPDLLLMLSSDLLLSLSPPSFSSLFSISLPTALSFSAHRDPTQIKSIATISAHKYDTKSLISHKFPGTLQKLQYKNFISYRFKLLSQPFYDEFS